jgi:hypothetical protein
MEQRVTAERPGPATPGDSVQFPLSTYFARFQTESADVTPMSPPTPPVTARINHGVGGELVERCPQPLHGGFFEWDPEPTLWS